MNKDHPERPRRFYKAASIAAQDGGFTVTLDGRGAKTPAGRPLCAPTERLARLLAEEWDAQTEQIDPARMPVTRLMNLVLDRGAETHEAVAAEAAKYAETDLVCHIADDVAELAAREEAVWAPLRIWAAETLGVALEPVAGVLAQPQPAESLKAAQAQALALDDVRLMALGHATALLGSVVLGFALVKGRLDADEAFAASRVDETYQEERWGSDAEAVQRAASLREELVAIEAVVRALD